MRAAQVRLIGCVLAALLAGVACADLQSPSFVVVLVDDQGWTGTSVAMDAALPESRSDFYRTPNLDAFAARGLRFSQAYSAAPSCSPSRLSLLTGKSPAQLGMTLAIARREPERMNPSGPRLPLVPSPSILAIPSDELTIAELLAERGYETAHLGKWHLSGGGPGEHGFGHFDPERSGGGRLGGSNPKDIFGITERAIAFMQRANARGRPFYLQISHFAVHWGVQARAETIEAVRQRPRGSRHNDVKFAAMTEDLDSGFGRLLEAIDALSLRERTYVFYLSDNGGAQNYTNNRPLSGGKGTLAEGGIRVPMLVAGPGVAEGAVSGEPVVGWDLLPTLLDLAGLADREPAGVEGGSLRPLLGGDATGRVARRRDTLIWHLPHYSPNHGVSPISAVRSGDMKLTKRYLGPELRLYDLAADVGEENDLAFALPELAHELERQLDAHLAAVGATLPESNPDYRPSSGG